MRSANERTLWTSRTGESPSGSSADLAEANSTIASKDSLLSDKRKSGSSDKEKTQKDLADMREAVTAVRDELRKLKEENAGLKARIRRLTDNNAGSGPSGGFKTV